MGGPGAAGSHVRDWGAEFGVDGPVDDEGDEGEETSGFVFIFLSFFISYFAGFLSLDFRDGIEDRVFLC